MADFLAAFDKTMGHEGGYASDPVDPGGETYMGISRRYHPAWSGWPIIDREQKDAGLDDRLRANRAVQDAVHRFYRDQFWNRFQGDAVDDQLIADEMFDTAVNMGVHRAVNFLQRGLNCLNRCGRSWSDIAEDGGFGPATLGTLRTYLGADSPQHLLTIMNVLQGMHYIENMTRNESQEKYARGWLKRVNLVRQLG